MTGLWVVLGTVVIALIAGTLLNARNGRIRHRATVSETTPLAHLPELVAEALKPATAVTLVQISTTFCAPCRHAKAVLSSLAERTDGVRHVEIDVTNNSAVARQLGVLRTPTTLALDPRGHE